jgi:hypothetical protein
VGEQVNVRPKEHLHRFRKTVCGAAIGSGIRVKASDMILTNKALRKGDKKPRFCLGGVEIRLGLHDEMLAVEIFLTALFLERFSDMVNEGKANVVGTDRRQLTELLGPAFKLEMLQHTRKYAFVTHVGRRVFLLLAIFPEDQRHGSINYRIGKRFARSLLHLKAVRTVIGSVWGLKKKPGICAPMILVRPTSASCFNSHCKILRHGH